MPAGQTLTIHPRLRAALWFRDGWPRTARLCPGSWRRGIRIVTAPSEDGCKARRRVPAGPAGRASWTTTYVPSGSPLISESAIAFSFRSECGASRPSSGGDTAVVSARAQVGWPVLFWPASGNAAGQPVYRDRRVSGSLARTKRSWLAELTSSLAKTLPYLTSWEGKSRSYAASHPLLELARGTYGRGAGQQKPRSFPGRFSQWLHVPVLDQRVSLRRSIRTSKPPCPLDPPTRLR